MMRENSSALSSSTTRHFKLLLIYPFLEKEDLTPSIWHRSSPDRTPQDKRQNYGHSCCKLFRCSFSIIPQLNFLCFALPAPHTLSDNSVNGHHT